jgi:hypothetical protein
MDSPQKSTDPIYLASFYVNGKEGNGKKCTWIKRDKDGNIVNECFNAKCGNKHEHERVRCLYDLKGKCTVVNCLRGRHPKAEAEAAALAAANAASVVTASVVTAPVVTDAPVVIAPVMTVEPVEPKPVEPKPAVTAPVKSQSNVTYDDVEIFRNGVDSTIDEILDACNGNTVVLNAVLDVLAKSQTEFESILATLRKC